MMLNDNKEEVRYEELRKQVAQLNNQRSERNMMTLNDTLADVRQREHLEQVERDAFTRQDVRNFETGLYLLEEPTPWARRMKLRREEEQQQAEQQQAQQQVIKSEEGEQGVTSDPYYLLQERW